VNGILSGMPTGILMDPRQAMMLQTGLGLMGASGPSLTPTSFGSALGKAGTQGLQAFQQTNQANQQNQLFQLKMAEVQREAAERKKKEAALAELMKDPRFAGMSNLLQVAPNAAIERAYPKDNKPMVVAPGSSLVDPEKPNQPLYTAPQRPEAPSNLAALIKERDSLPAGSPLLTTYNDAIKKASTANPLVNVDTRQETEFGKAVGRETGEMYAGMLKADMNAPASIAKYQRLGSLLSSVNTGKFKGTTTDLKAAAKSLGVDLNAIGVSDDVAPAQAARALSNQLALEMRNPAGGAGMPGALSDKDREFLVQSIPGLENDPAAIGTMVDYRVRLEKRAQQVARKAREYRRKNGKFDDRFFDELQDWSEKNPLFPEGGRKLSPETEALLDKYAPRPK
jgi:hypothetical protein